MDTTCSSLLRELQHIWDEVGESDAERDKLLLQLEQECLDVYRRKVDQANHGRTRLIQAIADSESELTALVAALGDRDTLARSDKGKKCTLKEHLLQLHPQLEELRKRKDERRKQFKNVKKEIHGILVEIAGSEDIGDDILFSSVAEEDLSLRKLEDYVSHLRALETEKGDRLRRVNEYVNVLQILCSVMSLDCTKILDEIHPTLTDATVSKSISDNTLESLQHSIRSLKLERQNRLKKMQENCAALLELWNLMDTTDEEKDHFERFTSVVGENADAVSDTGILSIENIQEVESEVRRLDKLKVSKTKELVLKKQRELETICVEAHMETNSTSQENMMAIIESGLFDAAELLVTMDQQIAAAKEEAQSRKEIMEKMDKWISACEEETWLDDYNRDDNRYNNSRGAHINLKRAEKARLLVAKLPVMIENLIQKTKCWEEEHAAHFIYDGVRLLDVLEQHTQQKKQQEEEKRKAKDQKKFQELNVAEQDVVYSTKPSPLRPLSAKKGLSVRPNNVAANITPSRRLSMAASHMTNTETLARKGCGITPVRSVKKEKIRPSAPVNYVAIGKEDL